MEKIKLDNSTRVFPMPMVVVGAVVEGKKLLFGRRVGFLGESKPSDDRGGLKRSSRSSLDKTHEIILTTQGKKGPMGTDMESCEAETSDGLIV